MWQQRRRKKNQIFFPEYHSPLQGDAHQEMSVLATGRGFPSVGRLPSYLCICLGIQDYDSWGFSTFCVVGQDNGHFTFSSFFS